MISTLRTFENATYNLGRHIADAFRSTSKFSICIQTSDVHVLQLKASLVPYKITLRDGVYGFNNVTLLLESDNMDIYLFFKNNIP